MRGSNLRGARIRDHLQALRFRSKEVLLKDLLAKISQPIEAVMFLSIADQILIERMLARGRKDDNESVISNRLKIYREQTSPLVNYYKSIGILKSVDGCGTVEDVNSRIKKVLN